MADSRPPDLLLPVTVAPLFGNQHPVPSQNRIGRQQHADLFQHLTIKDLPFHCQWSALVVVKQDTHRTELHFQYLIRIPEVLNNFLLLTVNPAADDHEAETTGFQCEMHRRADERDSATFLHPRSTEWLWMRV
jgi:hypothetical protein